MSRETTRWLHVAGALIVMFSGLGCSLLTWLCVTVSSLSLDVAEIRTELHLVKPSENLKALTEIDKRLTRIESQK